MDEKSERTTKMDSAPWGVASFEHSGLRGVNSAVEADIRRRALQMFSITAKLLISTTTTSSITFPSSLLLHPFAAAFTIFEVGECFLESRCVRLCLRILSFT